MKYNCVNHGAFTIFDDELQKVVCSECKQPLPLPNNEAGEKGLLNEVIDEYNFQVLESTRETKFPLYYLDCSPESNCDGRFIIRVLNDGSLRLSITEQDDVNLFHVIDLFEFKGFGKINDFMKIIRP